MATPTPTRTVEEVLRDGGFTSFHRRIVVITGFAWTFVAFEIILIAFVLPDPRGIFAAFGLSKTAEPVLYFLVASATLMGSFVGSLILGRLADARGRRTVFLVSILWYSLFTAATAVSWDAWSVFGFRFLAGLGLGGMLVVDPAMLSEFLPPQSRGRFMVLLDFFWPIGFLLAIGFWWAFLVQGVTVAGLASWRLLFIVAAFPAFIAFLARIAIPESPFYYARHGRLDEAAKVLTRIEGRPIDPAGLSREQGVPRAPLAALFQGSLLRRTVVTMLVWIALNFSYYGLFLSLPFALPVFTSVGSDINLLAWFFIVSALAQFPGYGVSMYLVERWGRKRTLALFLLLGGASGYAFATATVLPALFVSLAFVSFFNLGAWGAVYPYTSELFPTQYRATGFGLAEGVGKITAILGPVVFGALYASTGGNVVAPLTVIAVVMALGGVVLALIGPETKGQAFV
ncbi:MAG TPA: MFS transporter [Thermoplasmata archaeon]|nr:MFS transporter [Thermoplasmata archaeon]